MTWVKMSERKPEEGQLVLLAIKVDKAWYIVSGNYDFKGRAPPNNWTHWMPIEEPAEWTQPI